MLSGLNISALKSISDEEISRAIKVRSDHTVYNLSPRGALESLIWCIANQNTNWERPVKFIRMMREESGVDPYKEYTPMSHLTDKGFVNKIAKRSGLPFHRDNRFDPAIDYFGRKEGEWWKEIMEADVEKRERYVERIKFVGRKTFSFWHLCLGGKNLIALDIWIRRSLQEEFGMKYLEPYATGTPRTRKSEVKKEHDPHPEFDFVEGLDSDYPVQNKNGGRNIMPGLPKSVYIHAECLTRKLFGKDERFLCEGKTDMALVDCLLWWKGAHRYGVQDHIFGSGMATFIMPYGKPFR